MLLSKAVRREMQTEWFVVAALSCIWIALALLVDPRGNFPILDEWSYGRSVMHLVEHGELRYDGWNAPTLFLQVLYGALFAWLFGFSFEVLRFSTLIAGLAGGIGTYLLFREATAPRLVAVTASLALMLNPSYFQHSFTFMTDVPFTALVVWSSLFYVRSFRTASVGSIAAGTVLAACATLIRQPGVMLPVAFAIATVATSPLSMRTMARVAVPTLTVLMVYGVYSSALQHFQMQPALLGSVQEGLLARLVGGAFGIVVLNLLGKVVHLFSDLSLMVLPLVALLVAFKVGGNWRGGRALGGLLFGFAIALVSYKMPDVAGLPVLFSPLNPVMVGQQHWGPVSEHYRLRPMLEVVQAVAVALTVWVLLFAKGSKSKSVAEGRADVARAGAVFAFSATALLVAPFLPGHVFERYLVPAVPTFMLGLTFAVGPALGHTRPSLPIYAFLSVAIPVLIGFGALSLTLAHDVLLWNRLRWEAVDMLVKEKRIKPSAIDGGLPVNGWYLFPEEGPLRQRYVNSPFEKGHWWRNDGAEYIVAITNPRRLAQLSSKSKEVSDDDIDVVWRKAFKGWLPGAEGEVLVCRGGLCQRAFIRQ